MKTAVPKLEVTNAFRRFLQSEVCHNLSNTDIEGHVTNAFRRFLQSEAEVMS